MEYVANTWTFLNDALPSSVVGGVVAGFLVGSFLFFWTGRRSQKSRLSHIRKILKTDVLLNLSVVRELSDHLKSKNLESFKLASNPLKMSSIKLAASESYSQSMDPSMAILVASLLEDGDRLNNDYNRILGGPVANMQELVEQFPILLANVSSELDELAGLLKGVPLNLRP